MKLFLLSCAIVFFVLLLITSELFRNHSATLVRIQCQRWLQDTSRIYQSRPQLVDEDPLAFTKYDKIGKMRLKNQGGKRLHYCDGFDFPSGLVVKMTRDGQSCEISGVPMQAQGVTNAYIIAANQSGRSLAVVPIMVNAVVLQE